MRRNMLQQLSIGRTGCVLLILVEKFISVSAKQPDLNVLFANFYVFISGKPNWKSFYMLCYMYKFLIWPDCILNCPICAIHY